MKNLITCLTVCVLSSVVAAEIHHVPADFPTIQYAVDAASDGDEIVVAPGTYTSTAAEVVNMRGKEIWLHSSKGEQVTIIDGEGIRRGILCDNNETSNTVIEGFTITNGYDSFDGGGMLNNNSSPTLTNCTFTGNTADYSGGGMANVGNCSPTLTNCTFENNTANGNGGGIYNNYNSNPTLTNCIFENNTAGSSGGAIFTYAATINGCDFIQNISTNGGGIYSDGSNKSNSPTISSSSFCENDPDAIYGNWNNGDGNDFLNDCGDVEGACCVKEACYEVEFLFCDAIGGEWLGYNETCEVDTCSTPPQYGACCINGEAIPLFDYDCERILGAFMGEGTNPDDVACPTICTEDVTGDGVVDVSDLLAIIAVWGACP